MKWEEIKELELYPIKERPSEAMERIDNLVFSKNGNKGDQEAWTKIEEYIEYMEYWF